MKGNEAVQAGGQPATASSRTEEVACGFHRALRFRSRHPFWRALDSTLTRAILVRQSARALANLKRVPESR